jgi:hypothetical protein
MLRLLIAGSQTGVMGGEALGVGGVAECLMLNV